MKWPGFGVCLLISASLFGAAPTGDRAIVERTPGLVAFWTFGEEAGQPRRSSGTPNPHPLAEVGGPIARVAGGPFSGYAAELDGRQFFQIPYAETRDLNMTDKGTTNFQFAKPDGWPAGKYTLAVMMDGMTVQTREFEVK